MSGIRLTDSEKLALKWLAQEFPIGSSWENKLVHWSVITEGLSKAANIVGDTACDQTIRRFRELDLFESHRMSSNMFRGAVTTRGEQLLREDAAVAEQARQAGGPLKRLGRYVLVESGPILVQAIIGAVIGLVGGFLAGTVMSAVPTAIAAAITAGRVPHLRRP